MDDILNLMSHAVNKNPTEFHSELDSVLKARAAEAIEAKRIEVAQSIYGGEGPVASEDEEEEFDFDLDDLDLEEEEEEASVDDEDLDDLEDLDLEDIDDDD
jgi:hypothetical protein